MVPIPAHAPVPRWRRGRLRRVFVMLRASVQSQVREDERYALVVDTALINMFD